VIQAGERRVLVLTKLGNEGGFLNVVSQEELFDLLFECHVNILGHAGGDKMYRNLKDQKEIAVVDVGCTAPNPNTDVV